MKKEDLEIILKTYSKVTDEHGHETTNFQYKIPNVTKTELDIIDFSHFNMRLIIDGFRAMKELKTHNKNNIYNYISFSRFTKGIDKIGCDWCSICNGGLEMLHDTILESCNTGNILAFSNIPDVFKEWLKYYESFYLDHEYYQPLSYEDYIKPFKTKMLDDKTFSNIKLFLKVLHGVKQIEQRWCPFKHMKKLKFDRDYYIYNSHDTDEIEIVKDLLTKNGKIINGKKKKTNNNYTKGSSIFDEFVEYLENIII